MVRSSAPRGDFAITYSVRISPTYPPLTRLLVTLQPVPCSHIKSVGYEEWFSSWDIETAILECGLPFPEKGMLLHNSAASDPDRGGYSYSALSETVLDDISGLDWMVSCLVSFILAAQKSADPSRADLVARLAVCLLNWIIRKESSSVSSPCLEPSSCSIKRSYATLSIPRVVKSNIYRAIIASQVFVGYLQADPSALWTLSLRAYFQRYLGPISRDIIETCYETFLLHLLVRDDLRSLPEDTSSSDFEELSCAIVLTDCVLLIMSSHIRLMTSESYDPNEILLTASSWFHPSWPLIFRDILILAERIEASQPQLSKQSGLSHLTSSIASFVPMCTAVVEFSAVSSSC